MEPCNQSGTFKILGVDEKLNWHVTTNLAVEIVLS